MMECGVEGRITLKMELIELEARVINTCSMDFLN